MGDVVRCVKKLAASGGSDEGDDADPVWSRPRKIISSENPPPGQPSVLVKVLACGVCRTDLHLVNGKLPNPPIPVVPGNEIVGRIEAVGARGNHARAGDIIGIPWLGWACGVLTTAAAETI